MKTSEQIGDLAGALSKAQREIKGAVKDSQNPFFKSSYADLTSVWNACREALTSNSLAVIQTCSMGEHGVTVSTRLVHASGQWVEDDLTVMPTKVDPQGIGSAITYLRRYTLAAITGVAPEDDDGNAASEKVITPKSTLTTAQKNQVHADSLKYLEQGDEVGLMETWHGFGADEKAVLWAMFNSEQRTAMKKMMGNK